MVETSVYKKTVFLAGVGRSGTTWLSNIINFGGQYRYLFEPFHTKKVEEASVFRDRRYIRPGTGNAKLVAAAIAIMEGRTDSYWANHLNQASSSTSLLIKAIRANFYLKWLQELRPDIKFIMLLRHPCAIAYSQSRLGWGIILKRYFECSGLMTDILAPFEREMRACTDPFEQRIFSWCISNYVPLNQFTPDDLHVAFYEWFCVRPQQEVDRLFAFLDETYQPALFDVLKQPSALAWEGSAINTGEDLVGYWRNHITDQQIARASEILQLFRLQRFYNNDNLLPQPYSQQAHADLYKHSLQTSARNRYEN